MVEVPNSNSLYGLQVIDIGFTLIASYNAS